MFEIHLTCYEPPYDKAPYGDKVNKEFYQKCDALPCLLQCVIDEAAGLNGVENESLSETRFVIVRNFTTTDGKTHDAAILAYNAAQNLHEQPVTLYDITWVNNSEVDKYNQMLKDEFGDDLSLKICEFEDDDDKTRYCFCGITVSESKHYDNVKECYDDARDYMHNIDIYVD